MFTHNYRCDYRPRWKRWKDPVTCSGCKVLLCAMYVWCDLARRGLKWPRNFVQKVGQLFTYLLPSSPIMRRTREMVGIRNWRKCL